MEFLKKAEKELSKLPFKIQKQIANRLESLKFNPYPPDVKQLKNSNGKLRIRVGYYRIIYRIENNILVIVVIKVEVWHQFCQEAKITHLGTMNPPPPFPPDIFI